MSRNLDELFSSADADLIVESSDNVRFGVHKRNLATHSEVGLLGEAIGAGNEGDVETVCLTEASDTLELLFQFIYPQRQPDLQSISFERLSALSEAAEKYQVFSAMPICNIYMRCPILVLCIQCYWADRMIQPPLPTLQSSRQR